MKAKTNIEPGAAGLLLEGLGALGLLALIGLPAYHFGSLPEMVPTHFGADGRPDAFGEKGSILVLPMLGVALYVLLFLISRFPQHFNFPVKLTDENREKQYRNAFLMLRLLRVIIACAFALISWGIIRAAKGQEGGLGPYFLPVFLLVIFGAIAYYIWKSFQDR